jgi:hypothetical protein
MHFQNGGFGSCLGAHAFVQVHMPGGASGPLWVGGGVEAIDAALHAILGHMWLGMGAAFGPLQDESAAVRLCMEAPVWCLSRPKC